METIQLANSIRSISKKYYVPFVGYMINDLINHVQKHLDVDTNDVLLALAHIQNHKFINVVEFK